MWRPLPSARIACAAAAANLPPTVTNRVTLLHLHRKFHSVREQEPHKCIYSTPAQESAKHGEKLGRHRCTNEAKTQNPLKFAGVP